MPNVILAVIAAIEADAGVEAQIAAGNAPSPGVFDELPTADDIAMPTRVAIVRGHGGPPDPAPLQLNYTRVQIQSYGETINLAYQLDWAIFMRLKNLGPSVWAATYIHNCIRQSGPTPSRDPTLQWPVQTSTWLVKASDLTPP